MHVNCVRACSSDLWHTLAIFFRIENGTEFIHTNVVELTIRRAQELLLTVGETSAGMTNDVFGTLASRVLSFYMFSLCSLLIITWWLKGT